MRKELKEVVFNGGGARGAGMPGVYLALQETQFWDGIETMAGTSVGALSAAFFCVSPSHQEIKNELLGENFSKILGVDDVIVPLGLKTDRLEKFINDYLVRHVRKYLKQEEKKLAKNSRFAKTSEITRDLYHLSARIKKKEYALTFHDLYLLHKQCPEKFKKIIVTSTSQGKLHLYTHQTQPDVSIAEACIASSALPLIFSPIELNQQRHVDGGCVDPIPSEYFENNSVEQRSKRLLFVFGPGPSLLGSIWQKALYGRANPKVVFCPSKPNVSRSHEETIYVWSDEHSAQIHYQISSPHKVGTEHTISYTKLGIQKKSMHDYTTFEPYLDVFYANIAKRWHLKSVLGNYSIVWLLDYFSFLIQFVVGFKFQPMFLFETLCQRVRIFYPFNTVLLHTKILGSSFKTGEKIRETIEATYYLDTMNHLSLYQFDPNNPKLEFFYEEIVKNYLIIYKTYLKNQDIHEDFYTRKYAKHDNKSRFLYEIIKADVESDPCSPRAFALTSAVQLHLNQKKPEEILEKINHSKTHIKNPCLSFLKPEKIFKQEQFIAPLCLSEETSKKSFLHKK